MLGCLNLIPVQEMFQGIFLTDLFRSDDILIKIMMSYSDFVIFVV